jgi:hypothetical protein
MQANIGERDNFGGLLFHEWVNVSMSDEHGCMKKKEYFP